PDPVSGGPKCANKRSEHPCARNPVVAGGRPVPIAGRPYIVVARARWLLVDRQLRRRLLSLDTYIVIGVVVIALIVVIVAGIVRWSRLVILWSRLRVGRFLRAFSGRRRRRLTGIGYLPGWRRVVTRRLSRRSLFRGSCLVIG